MTDYIKNAKEFGAYPVSITLIGIIAIIITMPKESRNLIHEIFILLLSFIFLLVFNTLYFKWLRKNN